MTEMQVFEPSFAALQGVYLQEATWQRQVRPSHRNCGEGCWLPKGWLPQVRHVVCTEHLLLKVPLNVVVGIASLESCEFFSCQGIESLYFDVLDIEFDNAN